MHKSREIQVIRQALVPVAPPRSSRHESLLSLFVTIPAVLAVLALFRFSDRIGLPAVVLIAMFAGGIVGFMVCRRVGRENWAVVQPHVSPETVEARVAALTPPQAMQDGR